MFACQLKTGIRSSDDKPWITHDFKDLIAKRQHYFQSGNQTMYKLYRNRVNRQRKLLTNRYYEGKVKQLKSGDSRLWWRKIKELTGLGNKHQDLPTLAANLHQGDARSLSQNINDVFASVAADLTPLCPTDNFCFGDDRSVSSQYIIEPAVIEKQLASIKTTKAMGPDNHPNWVLKSMSSQLASPVCSIINASFREGYIPEVWKSSDVAPIPKNIPLRSLDKDLRPISLSPVLSKVAEKHIKSWIMLSH